ncbi:MAG: hypothetical protein IID33_12735 [Planctomycetes bacterium]|nr:hypothetical protein [Planctomycetota bacterium]
MLRRVAALILMIAAAPPLAYGVRLLGDDLIRGCAILVVALVGVAAALPALIGSKVAVVAWLRLLAIGLAVVTLATMLAVWYFLEQVAAPDIQQQLARGAAGAFDDQAELRARLEAYRTFAERLLWLSGAVLICGCSIATLPGVRTVAKSADGDAMPPSQDE